MADELDGVATAHRNSRLTRAARWLTTRRPARTISSRTSLSAFAPNSRADGGPYRADRGRRDGRTSSGSRVRFPSGSR